MANAEVVSISNADEGIVSLEEEFLRMKNEEIIHKTKHLFFPIPKPLLDSCEDFYIPNMVSIGPHHYGKEELRLELHKVEAMRRMEIRIQQKFPQSTLKSIVDEKIKGMEKEIRDCYEKKFDYSPKELAWMVTGDVCFIYEFILSYCRSVQFINVEEHRICAERYDSIFDSCGMNPMWRRILFDLLLFENQIPLRVLELLVEMALGSREALEERLYRNWLTSLISRRSVGVFSWYVSPPSGREDNHHILGAFYHAVVGTTSLYRQDDQSEDFRKPGSADDSQLEGFLVPKLPSAKELKQKGVKFQCIDPTNSPPIQCVRFDEKTATLWLPQVHVDVFRIALIRNFIAMEVTNDMYAPYPMTSFAILMNELIDNAEDCRLLSEERIIVPMLGSDEEVAKAFNSIIHGMEMRSSTCKSIDNVRAGLRKYLQKKCRILRSEFYSTNLSKPWGRLLD